MRTAQITDEQSPPQGDDFDPEEISSEDHDEELTPEQMAAFADLIRALRREGHADSDSVRMAIQSQAEQAQNVQQQAAVQHQSRAQQQAVVSQLQTAYQGEIETLRQTLSGRMQKGDISQEQASALFDSLAPDIQQRYASTAEHVHGQVMDSQIGSELQAALAQYPSLAANDHGGARLVATLAKLSHGQYPVGALAELFDTSVAHAAHGRASEMLDQARESAVAEYLAKQNQNASFAPPVVPAGGGASTQESSRPSVSDWTHDLFRRAGLK